MTIWTRVKTALSSLTVPVVQSQYVGATPNTLPDTFVVFFLVSGAEAQAADNTEIQRDRRVQVSIFSRAGLESLPDVDTLMTAAGFRCGPEQEIPYDATTRHYGLAKDYFYLD